MMLHMFPVIMHLFPRVTKNFSEIGFRESVMTKNFQGIFFLTSVNLPPIGLVHYQLHWIQALDHVCLLYG